MGRAGKMAELQECGNLRQSEIRKSRHNKVYTAKGPKDRRVRLSANTAIQFYDVQDRLGFDRATEAVEWLINKAKASIDNLFHITSCQNPGFLTDTSTENSVQISEQTSLLFPYCHNDKGFFECSENLEQVQRSGVSSDDEIMKFYVSSNQEEQNVGYNHLMQISHLE